MRLAVLLLVAVFSATASHAGDALSRNAAVCNTNDATPADQRIAACTWLIKQSYALPSINRAEALFRRSYAYDASHDYDRAIDDLTEALKLQPRNLSYLNNRAYTWKLKGDIDHRLADYQTAYDIDPHFHTLGADLSNTLVDRGDRSEVAGRLGEAIADYDRALLYSPDSYGALNNLGMAYVDGHDYRAAVERLEKAVAVAPDRFEAYETLGQAFAGAGELDHAVESFSKSLAINPNKALNFNRRGDVYRRLGKLPLALADEERAVALDPGLTDASAALEQIRAALPQQTAAADTAPPTGTPGLTAATKPPPPPPPPNDVQRPSAAGHLGRRVALVIGNGGYETVARLANPPRDADLVARTLRNAGFESVTLAHDVTRAQFEEILRGFAEQAAGADWAVVYFAGHGIEMNGSNYLIPIDAKLTTDRAVQFEAIPLDQIQAAVEGAKTLKLIMLDACRNNPFDAAMSRSLGTRSIGRGLARIEPAAGEIVAFAASPGQIAEDGDSGDSPFAAAFAAHVGDPDEEIYQFFRVVHDEVVSRTDAKQQPYINASLSAEKFYFTPRPQ